ncbi:MAG: hypothetical protein ACOZAL_01245 [Patescibacteria group bacterium]
MFQVTFWFKGADGIKQTRTLKVLLDTNDKNLAGAEAERLTEIKSYIRRKVELLPPYTDPWER